MSFRLGLTGSIGMGKSTTAQMFVDAGCVVWDADAAVHRLYAVGGAAVAPIASIYPDAVQNGMVDRTALKRIISDSPNELTKIERIVHPLVAADRADFVEKATTEIIVFDIPLLFETGGETQVDAVAVVSATAQAQRARVLARGTMSEAQFEQILAKQMPDAEKRQRADYIIETNSLPQTAARVQEVVSDIRSRIKANA